MYTEKSIELKSDFYCRYGSASGHMYFERTGTPCVLMRGSAHMIAFAFKSGVRACGRKYGDVIKILDTRSNVSDISFAQNGLGAQILYETDIEDMRKNKETAEYTIDKLLKRMEIGEKYNTSGSLADICDNYGSRGWCAYHSYGETVSVPFPLGGYNVIVIRTQKNGRLFCGGSEAESFEKNETKRIVTAAEALRACREDILFNMLNRSERDIEAFMAPSAQAVKAVRAAMEAGACAARICDPGIVCITEKSKTDSAVHAIAESFERAVGYAAGISVVY